MIVENRIVYMKARFVCDDCNISIDSEIGCNVFNIAGMPKKMLSPVAVPATFTICGDDVLCKKCDDKRHEKEKLS